MINQVDSNLSITDEVAQKLSLKANFSWVLVGNIIYQACQWGILSLMTKLVAPDIVGVYAFGLAVTTPVIIFSNMDLRAVQATDTGEKENKFGDYLGLRLITSSFAFLIIIILLSSGSYSNETTWVIFFVGLSKTFESISDVFYGFFQQHERMDRLSKSQMVRGILSLGGMSIGLYLTHNIVWGSCMMAILGIFPIIAFDIRYAINQINDNLLWKNRDQNINPKILSSLSPRWDKKKMLTITRLGLPLGITMMLISLNTNIPRYLIERILGTRELGIFASLMSGMVAGRFGVNALVQSVIPRLAKLYSNGNRGGFVKLLLRVASINAAGGLLGVGAAILWGRRILLLLFTKEYAAYSDLFVWVMIAGLIFYIYSILGAGMTAAHYFSIQPFLLITTIVVSLSGGLVLIPRFGIYGAVFSVIASAAIQLLIGIAIIIFIISKNHPVVAIATD